jgi:hypothetical protein
VTCRFVEVDQRFRGARCLHRHDGGNTSLKRRSTSTRLHGAISQNRHIVAGHRKKLGDLCT